MPAGISGEILFVAKIPEQVSGNIFEILERIRTGISEKKSLNEFLTESLEKFLANIEEVHLRISLEKTRVNSSRNFRRIFVEFPGESPGETNRKTLGRIPR